ncbi:MAG: hypothetical protein KBI44_10970 [Thermoanaerobaculia bacterium]|nr:hypothetical protein [Thermoanaerobaculia bacterium]
MDCQRPLTTDRDRPRPVRRERERRSCAVATLALLATLAASPPAATAASHRLSQGLPFSDVPAASAQLSPDGHFAVYIHDATVDEARELWSVRVAGGAPVRLSGPLPGSVTVDSFAISADSQRVVYTVAQETAGQVELYSIPIAGPEGSWTQLNGELPAGGDVLSLKISPDSTRVVYVADQQANDVFDAWTVPIAGGTPIRLRPFVTLAGSGVLDTPSGPSISPDSERVVFHANFSDLDYWELWSARVDGTGGIVQLTEATAASHNVFGNRFSPDSSRVLYFGYQQDNVTTELYGVPSAGGSAVKLNGLLTPGGNVWSYVFSPDSTRVVYLAAQQTAGVDELYSVPLAGGGVAKLNGALTPNGEIFEATISPDSARVVYRGDEDTDEVFEIFSVPLAGGSAVKLNPALPAGGSVLSLAIAPDSARVVYRADQNDDEVQELFSVPLAGGTSVRVSDEPVFGGDIADFKIAPASDFVFYRGDILTDGVHELFRGTIAGISSAAVRVSGPMVAGGSVGGASSWAVLPDGRQAIYNADQEVDLQNDLYLGDVCLLCDGFEAGDSSRWN